MSSSSDKTTHPETASTCQGCLSNCAVRVCVDGANVRFSGNSASAASKGAICPALPLTNEQRIDPDRITTPLRRTNPRKGRGHNPRFVPVSWGEALDEIADYLIDLRRRGVPERLAVAKGRSSGIADIFHKALPDIFGTPNRLNHAGICAEAEYLATGVCDGHYCCHDYDFDHTRCVILWGTDPLVGNRQKAAALKMWPALAKRASLYCVSPQLTLSALHCRQWLPLVPGTDAALALAIAHVILVEGLWNRPFVGDFIDGKNRFTSVEGSFESDEEDLVGLENGAYVLRTFDESAPHPLRSQASLIEPSCFSEHQVSGIILWWNEEVRFSTPSWASQVTGIPSSHIVEMARTFAAAAPAAISWISPGVAMTANGNATARACWALNALVGSLGAQGGVRNFPSAPTCGIPDTAPFKDQLAHKHTQLPPIDGRGTQGFMAGKQGDVGANQVTGHTPDMLCAATPYPIEVFITYWTNLPFSSPGPRRWEQALETMLFHVDISTNLSELSQYADIVLPAKHHLFETWGFANGRANGHATIGLQQPCAAAPGKCQGDETWIPWELALKFEKRGFPNLAEYYRTLTDPIRGTVPRNGDDLAIHATMRGTERLWNITRDDFAPGDNPELNALRTQWEKEGKPSDQRERFAQKSWRLFRHVGVWNSPAAKNEYPLATPSGTFELFSLTLERMLVTHAEMLDLSLDEELASLEWTARGTRALLPHYEAPLRCGDEALFPLIFTQNRSRWSLEGRSANTPSFQRLKAADPGDKAYDDVIKIHPFDMEKFGLSSGQKVCVSSLEGSITVTVSAWEGTRPGVASKCYGQGHWAYGGLAALDPASHTPRGGNNNELFPCAYERASSAVARHGGLVRVRVEPAG